MGSSQKASLLMLSLERSSYETGGATSQNTFSYASERAIGVPIIANY